MKKILILFSLLCGLLSCTDKFLNLTPLNQPSGVAFYKTAKDMDGAVIAAYSALTLDGQYTRQYILTEERSDNTDAGTAGSGVDDINIDLFAVATTNSYVSSAWQDGYIGISRCNTLLDRIGGVTMDQTLKDQYIAEARFLRALMYFNLVRYFGDVPLVLTETKTVAEGYEQARKPVAEVYEQIIDDLAKAGQSLPVTQTGTSVGRATKGAAKALLGKVYLTLKNYPAAKTVLKEVIDQNTYQLLPKYADNFVPANAFNKESLFEVSYKAATGVGSGFTNYFAPRGDFGTINGIGAGNDVNIPTQDLINTYERKNNVIADQRYYASIDTGYTNLKGVYVRVNFIKKYLYPNTIAFVSDVNWPVLRYADVLLMYAEVLNEQEGAPSADANQALNAVRTRAGLAALTNLSTAAFRLAVERERRVELAFENQRWFDLVRTGRAVAVMNAHFAARKLNASVKEYQLFYPVPQNQIDVNPKVLTQNPGY